MSVTMTKADGVTTLTLTVDPQSTWPPLCQILKGLCCSPVCCSVSQHLRRIQRASQSVLGTLQIMVGLLNLGLGAILLNSGSGYWWENDFTAFPLWLGALFIVFGIVCILSEKYPSPCLVILSVVLNLAGVGFAIAAIVLYIIYIGAIRSWWGCDDRYRYRSHHSITQSPVEHVLQEKCLEAQELSEMLQRGMNGVLIVLSFLELSVVISSVVLGIKALCSREKEPDKSPKEPEYFKPLLDEVTTDPGA